jgi:hypothetical protein
LSFLLLLLCRVVRSSTIVDVHVSAQPPAR